MPTEVKVIDIIVSADIMTALARINADGDLESCSESSLLAALAARSVRVTEDTEERVRLLVERLKAGDIPAENVVLAQGIEPVPGKDGTVEWEPECDPAQRSHAPESDGADIIDHYARTSILSVSQGDLLCTIVPPTEGTPGQDILGREVPPQKGRRVPITFAETIVRDGDSDHMVAAISGRLNVIAQRAWISPLLVINRNVDFEVGNIKFDGDVVIGGNILDLFQVDTSKDLVVKGMIEAAQVNCKGSLTIVGGIAGKEKAVINVGGDVRARFIDNATVIAAGDIHVQKELVNSQIVTHQQLMTNGAITACRVEAGGGIHAGIVGSRSGIRTALMVGSSAEAFRRLSTLDREQARFEQRIERQQAGLEPMLRQQKALPKIQKNMAIRLLSSIKEDMTKLNQIKAEKEALQQTIKANRHAFIRVSRLIHEGTTVQIGKALATLRDSLRGPLKLITHPVDGTDRIAASSDQGGIVILESYK